MPNSIEDTNFEYLEDTKQMLYNGVILPSVGSIIRPIADTYYTDDIPEEVLEEAKYKGTVVHEAVDHFIKTGEIKIKDPKYQGYLNSFIQWFLKAKPQILANEIVLHTNKYWGIADIICTLNGKNYIIDLKTSSKLIKELIELQLTGYKNCSEYMEMNIDGIMGLHLTKEKFNVHLLEFRYDQFNKLVEEYYK